MTVSVVGRSLDELTLGGNFGLEDLVNRETLGELAQSFFELFGVSLRIYGIKSGLLADATPPIAVYHYWEQFPQGRHQLSAAIESIKRITPPMAKSEVVTEFTGASYHITTVGYDERAIGRVIVGPYRASGLESLPEGLGALVPGCSVADAWQRLLELRALDSVEVQRIATYLGKALDLILFSGHRALLTSSMHMASVRESYHELREKNAKLQQAYDRLKELDRLKSNFLATVSHELRTPLTSIIGYSEMLAAGIAGQLSEEQGDFVQTIRDKGEQLLELIKGLLDLSKLESGTLSLRKADLDVARLIEDATNTLMPSARKKGVELLTVIEDGLPPLWGDLGRLRQVLLNLGENAIKFTPPQGTISIQASTCEWPDDEDGTDEGAPRLLAPAKRRAVEIRVTDTGIGIPEHERVKVFDSFYQVDGSATREQGGTGLGLSIVKRLVDAHDGSVTIESNQPMGSVFVVRLRCKPPGGT
jgi:signal transduction histidine kinase